MSNSPGAHISLVDVTHRYRRGQANAVEGVNLELQPGEATALIGRSGCGKSTLLHIMSGLMIPNEGQIYVDGKKVEGPSPRWIVMFQQASLYPWMSVCQNVALGLRFTGRKKEARSRVPELLDLVELGAFADRNVQDLSGGQQQRVALARSLAVHPEVLFLDEPFSSLDTFTRSALQRDVRRIAKDIGITLVLVSHDITEAVAMVDRAIVMAADPGRVRADVPIALSAEDRMQSGPPFQQARAQLQREFEIIAGTGESTSAGADLGDVRSANQSDTALAV